MKHFTSKLFELHKLHSKFINAFNKKFSFSFDGIKSSIVDNVKTLIYILLLSQHFLGSKIILKKRELFILSKISLE